MILRGQIPKYQLLFEVEIEKIAKRNRMTSIKIIYVNVNKKIVSKLKVCFGKVLGKRAE